MEAIIMLAMPIVVSILTQVVKQIESIKFSESKGSILRFFALTVSFIGAVLTGASDGSGVNMAEVELYAQAFLTFMATQVPYWLAKIRN